MPSSWLLFLMDPELEALLKSYDTFLEARGGSDEQRLFALYESRLEDAAMSRQINRETLDQALPYIGSGSFGKKGALHGFGGESVSCFREMARALRQV